MIIASVQAQHQNLGDLVIRRNMLDWLRDLPDVRVIAGDMPDPYLEALRIPKDHRVFSGLSQALVQKPVSPLSLVFAPGEQRLLREKAALVPSAANLAISLLAKASGGRVAKLGRGFHGSDTFALGLERIQTRISDQTLVRDSEASKLLYSAQIMPDIALSGGVSSNHWESPKNDHRNGLCVSFRFDRTAPANELEPAVRALRETVGDQLIVPTQVEFDEHSNKELARVLGGEFVGWDGSHLDQLKVVEEAYGKVRIVVSDRLHVLLFGMLRGAIPLGIETGKHHKLIRQLSPLGLEEFVIDWSQIGVLGEWSRNILPKADGLVSQRLAEAQGRLLETRRRFVRLFDSR